MLDALIYILLTLMGCGLFISAPYLLGTVYSALDFFYRWTCWLLHLPLYCVRRVIRWINWEKVSMFALAGSLILVTMLTVMVPRNPTAAPNSEIDTGIYEGLRVAFSIFEGDSADFRDHMTTSPLVGKGVFWSVFLRACACLLPILVPISTLSTAATLLWNHLPHHVPFFSRNWYIFSELEPNSIRMACSINEDLKKEKDTGVFIFLRTRRGEQTPETLYDIRKLNYYLYPKTEARFLLWPQRRLRRMRFFFLSDNTDENFERMQDFLNVAKGRWLFFPMGKIKDDVFQQEMYLLSETESAPMLIGHLRDILKTSGCFRNTELRLLDRFRATSYALLRDAPLYKHIQKDSQENRLNILVLGFGRIGREFFRAACSLSILQGCTTEFTLFDQQIDQKLNAFLCQCPELRGSVSFHGLELDAETDQLDALIYHQQFHYILVALGDDERNIRTASRLKRHYRRFHWNNEARQLAGYPDGSDIQPQICVNIEDSIKHDYTHRLWADAKERENAKDWDIGLHVFGGLDQVFTLNVLMPQNLWAAARYVHRELNSIPPADPLHWGEYERRSSIACAVRAEYLCDTVCDGKKRKEYENNLRPDDQSKFADVEHLRWMAYVRSEGLRHADTNLVEAYYDSDHGKHVDILGKLTPCLTKDQERLAEVWDNLSTGKHAADYADKKPFRWRDEHLVELAGEISRRADPNK